MGLFERIANSIKIDKAMKKGVITQLPLSFSSTSSNAPQIRNTMYAADVQSWNPETHPEGRGRSHLVKDIDYNDGHLSVTYNDGFTAGYEDISRQEAEDFIKTDSKGRWALKNLWNKPYETE